MMKRILFFPPTFIWILFFLISQTTAQTAKLSPIDEVRAVLLKFSELNRKGELHTEAARKLLIDEVADPKTDSISQLSDKPDKVVLIEKDRAVGRFQYSGAKRTVDIYYYLKNEGDGWKIYALRVLALPGLMEQLYDLLQEIPDRNEEQKWQFANLKLTFATDQELHLWFSENSNSLSLLYGALPGKKNRLGGPVTIRANDKTYPKIAEMVKKMNLGSIYLQPNGNAEFLIGGMADNSVGFFYWPSGHPPPITTLEYIWVEPLPVKNWYLFRTT
jgi:hypothetical protein